MTRIICPDQVAAFLNLIAISEGTSTSLQTQNDGYDVIVSGIDGAHTFTDYSAHPFAAGREPIVVRKGPPPLDSTASGRYQITLPTWQYLTEVRQLTNFTPQSQDLAALALLGECHALSAIIVGHIADAIDRASTTWASFPGNSYGQGEHTLEWLLGKYALQLTTL